MTLGQLAGQFPSNIVAGLSPTKRSDGPFPVPNGADRATRYSVPVKLAGVNDNIDPERLEQARPGNVCPALDGMDGWMLSTSPPDCDLDRHEPPATLSRSSHFSFVHISGSWFTMDRWHGHRHDAGKGCGLCKSHTSTLDMAMLPALRGQSNASWVKAALESQRRTKLDS